MKDVRIGIVGTGIMARSVATALSGERDVRIAAIAGRTLDGARALAADLPPGVEPDAVLVTDDYRELCHADEVDAVVVTTPDDLHADVMVAAAQGGKAVLVEKPFTTSTADADRAVAAIRAAGVTAMCLFNHRWVPAYAQAKTIIADLGAPVMAYARKDDTIEVPTEMIRWASRTTCAWFLSSHDIDLVTWLFDDRIDTVTAVARTGLLASRGVDTPDAIQIQARFRGGAIATFESAWIYPNTFPTTTDSYMTLVTEHGAIQLDRQQESIAVATESRFEYPRNMLQRVVHGVPAGAYRDALRHFVECCRTGAEPLVDVESARHVTAVLDAAHRSIASGLPETVDPEA